MSKYKELTHHIAPHRLKKLNRALCDVYVEGRVLVDEHISRRLIMDYCIEELQLYYLRELTRKDLR